MSARLLATQRMLVGCAQHRWEDRSSASRGSHPTPNQRLWAGDSRLSS
ncbi:hypothetical protein [Microcoleus anatoxicus]